MDINKSFEKWTIVYANVGNIGIALTSVGVVCAFARHVCCAWNMCVHHSLYTRAPYGALWQKTAVFAGILHAKSCIVAFVVWKPNLCCFWRNPLNNSEMCAFVVRRQFLGLVISMKKSDEKIWWGFRKSVPLQPHFRKCWIRLNVLSVLSSVGRATDS